MQEHPDRPVPRAMPRSGEEERWAEEGEEGEEGSSFEGSRHRHGVVMSCFYNFIPQSPSPTVSYLHSLSLCTFAHFIRSSHSRNGLTDTCRWCERRSNSITTSPRLPPPLNANEAAHNLFALFAHLLAVRSESTEAFNNITLLQVPSSS